MDMDAALACWHAVASSRNHDAIYALLADDVVFESPVVHTPQRGRAISAKYLTVASIVLGGAGFAYIGEWRGANSAVLEFTSFVDGITINGIDMVTWNDAGQIVHFKVMVRPLKAMNKLHEKMGTALPQLA